MTTSNENKKFIKQLTSSYEKTIKKILKALNLKDDV